MSVRRIFICDECGTRCESQWDESQAVAELRERFGPSWRPSQCIIVCAPCYEKLYPEAAAAKARRPIQ